MNKLVLEGNALVWYVRELQEQYMDLWDKIETEKQVSAGGEFFDEFIQLNMQVSEALRQGAVLGRMGEASFYEARLKWFRMGYEKPFRTYNDTNHPMSRIVFDIYGAHHEFLSSDQFLAWSDYMSSHEGYLFADWRDTYTWAKDMLRDEDIVLETLKQLAELEAKEVE